MISLNSNNMKKKIDIQIREIKNRDGEYIAYVQSRFLGATYSVLFQDNLHGSIALQNFSQMISYQFDEFKVNFVLSAEKLAFTSPALLDVMSSCKRLESEKKTLT